MKRIYIIIFIGLSYSMTAQEDVSKILAKTNVLELQTLSNQFASQYKIDHGLAISKAIEMGWDTVNLTTLDSDGTPNYNSIDNIVAAATTNTDALYTGGGLGLNLDGAGFVGAIWEAFQGANAYPLTTHFNLGNGTTSTVTISDGGTGSSNHATHVAGTFIGDGTHNDTARGMAPSATLLAYNASNDASEMATAAANGLLVSNHSYGARCGWRWNSGAGVWEWWGGSTQYNSSGEDPDFGQYSATARQWDIVAFNAPKYLVVKSSGNDRDDNPIPGVSLVRLQSSGTISTYSTASHPPGDMAGMDNIPEKGVAKNILTVGAIDGSSGNVITAFSSVGPADDGRIKPDIVGHGENVFSSIATGNTNYDRYDGTSMSAPNVAGSALLLQEHYEDLNGSGNFMNSATLKALIIHTATDLGNPGPDYTFGWGLMNAGAAAQLLTDADNEDGVVVLETTNNQSFEQYGLISTCAEDITATMVYTDPAGNAQGGLDVTTPALVNDLDMTLFGTSTSDFPWVLDLNNPGNNATTGDNDVDNVEQIISSGSQNMQILQVTNEGALTGGSQDYSLIMTGIEETCEVIAFTQNGNTLTSDETYCSTILYATQANIPSGREITYTNPDKIILSPGFHAHDGSSVHAYILEECP